MILDEVEPPGVGGARGRVRVTSHAQLAYLQRVDPNERFPSERVRSAWRLSDPVIGHPAARSADGLVLIYEADGERATILTVYPSEREWSS